MYCYLYIALEAQNFHAGVIRSWVEDMFAMDESRSIRECRIEQVGKARNGRPRYWCLTHGAGATGHFGIKLAQCESAYRDNDILEKALVLSQADYPAGVALWGAVPPVYDTTGLPQEKGIHVHARKVVGDDKAIDDTFPAVRVKYSHDLFTERSVIITQEAGVNYYISKFLKHDVKSLFCVHCGELHLDADYFAVHAHRTHLCHGCGKLFKDTSGHSVSNPVIKLQSLWKEFHSEPKLVPAKESISIKQSDFSGGIQIWASNPALLWTFDKNEEEGIHVHAYEKGNPRRVIDQTFSSVSVDGVTLPPEMVGHLMAQRALQYLANKIVSLQCPNCGAAHFDRGKAAFHPYKNHQCGECGATIPSPGRRQKVVSNPLAAMLDELRKSIEVQRQ